MEEVVLFDGKGVIQRDSPVPYYYQLVQYIEKKIKTHEWKPGQVLPSEQEFCEHLDVSRTVVRQAMTTLANEGLVNKQNGKRSSVGHPKYTGGLMQDLRGFHEDALAKGQRPSTRVLELKVIPANGDVAEALRLKEGEPVIMLNRLRFLDGEPTVLVVTHIPERMCPSLVGEDLASRSLYEVLATKYNLVITKGFRTIEAVSATRQEARLLGVKAGSPLLLLKSIGLLEDGTPLEYFIARHRGDRSKFQVRLVRNT
jgi:GntR family transcriptional regulator